jgi:2'-hydroxyisoflavone reductase
MKLLILGGTLYLGRHTVEAALARGHQLTLFNRGQTNPELFPNVERLVGNRDGNLKALERKTWMRSSIPPVTFRASYAKAASC